ncbi:unnamed protein product [Phytomonas sp. EM1]|nr:unnamed protein product [Phytomonas sp. EM1]|eukprot:CCW59594.1 unnamed protein product [Phytomonas sp. isolate EM1]
MQPKVPQTRRAPTWQRCQKQFSGIDFNVQDRRHHARILLESMQRRNQLFPLSNEDIAHRLHRYRDAPNEVLDNVQLRLDRVNENTSISPSKKIGQTHKTSGEKSENGEKKEALPPLTKVLVNCPATTAQYDEWLANGCPTADWDVFLHEELYGPEKDRDTFYALKYSVKTTH